MNEKQREQARLRKQRQRDKERAKSVTSGSVTPPSVTGITRGNVTPNVEKKRQGVTKGITQGKDNSVGITEQGLTKDGTFFNVEYIPASYGLAERPRSLSDGQTLDRANQTKLTNLEAFRARYGNAMLACNRANAYRNTMSQQEKLGRLLVSLDKVITGLDGKKMSLLDTVRYGIGGPTFREIKDAIK